MHSQSFYVDPKDVAGDEIRFSGEESHHLCRVLRKKNGDEVQAVDGMGTCYQVRLNHVSAVETRGIVTGVRRRIGEPVAEITLAQGVMKGDRFDWLVEKATEIGVRRIIPMISGTSVVTAGARKITRWKRVAMAAMKQSGRCILPEITDAKPLKQVVPLGIDCPFRFVAHPGAARPLTIPETDKPLLTPRVFLMAGPEGGFEPDELEMIRQQGFIPVTLGPRRLRSETAGIVLLTLALSHLNELV